MVSFNLNKTKIQLKGTSFHPELPKKVRSDTISSARNSLYKETRKP